MKVRILKLFERRCVVCGDIKMVTHTRHLKSNAPKCRSCSSKYLNSIRQGNKYKNKQGYINVLLRGHPMANSCGYVLEHRLVMYQKLGRKLDRNEHIHHVNGKRDDNRPENLQVLSPSEHQRVTSKEYHDQLRNDLIELKEYRSGKRVVPIAIRLPENFLQTFRPATEPELAWLSRIGIA